MCRLLGLTAGREPISASFWLLDAPDSLEVQSRRNADGSGIGFFGPSGTPVLDKQPEAAFRDEEFTREAKQARSPVFVAHVRWASVGGRTVQNTHPFAMQGRIMAHNGGLGDVARLAEQLGSYRDLVLGETDSEHYFALITQQIDAHGGDVGAGIAAAAGWIAARLPVSSLNAVVAAPGELWALRYPGQHALHIIERPAGARSRRPRPAAPRSAAGQGWPAAATTASAPACTSAARRRRCTRPALQELPSVVWPRRLDQERGWRMLAASELVHRPDLVGRPLRRIPRAPGPAARRGNIDT
jgi:glutamine amidotransferase